MIKIIAEAGCNWRVLDDALCFIDNCKYLGLFATKFQIFNKELIKNNPNFLRLQDLILDKEDVAELFYYGQDIGQEVFFTPMFLEAVDWCEEIGIKYYKIRYADRNNVRLLEKIASTGKPTFLSCDKAYLNWDSISDAKVDEDLPRLLYCIPKYPARYIDYLKNFPESSQMKKFAGISDHTSGLRLLEESIWHSIPYFEKHIKLDGTCPLEDAWSVSFSELKEVLNK